MTTAIQTRSSHRNAANTPSPRTARAIARSIARSIARTNTRTRAVQHTKKTTKKNKNTNKMNIHNSKTNTLTKAQYQNTKAVIHRTSTRIAAKLSPRAARASARVMIMTKASSLLIHSTPIKTTNKTNIHTSIATKAQENKVHSMATPTIPTRRSPRIAATEIATSPRAARAVAREVRRLITITHNSKPMRVNKHAFKSNVRVIGRHAKSASSLVKKMTVGKHIMRQRSSHIAVSQNRTKAWRRIAAAASA